jgi:DeoR/GlpR family transcriptional regulator of sugar metabolism
MDAKVRRTLIEERVAAEGEIEITPLASEFNVSEMTIRRDIEVLETQGLVRKVIGGAIAASRKASEPPFEARAVVAVHEKAHIAEAAVSLLEPGETVILDSGSTVLAVARAIKGRDLGLTVVTPSTLVALELADDPGTTVLLTGGLVRPGELSLIGSDAEEAFTRYSCDIFVMGVAGVDSIRGATDYHREEAAVKRAAIKAADRIVAAVDHTKLGRVHLVQVAPLEALDVIVTDGPEDDLTLRSARAHGILVQLVPQPLHASN